MKKILLCLSICLLTAGAHAAWQPIVQNFLPRQYEAGTQNWQLMQSQDGWIYSANNYGVMEYDGKSWRTVGLSNSTIVRRVCGDYRGIILAGGTDEFGFFKHNEDKELIYHSLSERVPGNYRPFGEIWGIEETGGVAYFQSRHYVFITDSAGMMEIIDPGSIIYASLLHNNELYLSTDHGIYLYAGKRLHRLMGSEQLEGKTISAMAATNDGRILIGTDFHGIYQYDEHGIRPLHTDVDAFLRRNQLYSIAIDDNRIALGTVLMGLVIIDGEGHVEQYINREQGLQNNTVLSLLFDRDHNLWVGLDQGIDHISLSWPTEYLHEEPPYGVGYAYLSVGQTGFYGTNQGLYYSRSDSEQLQLIDSTAGQVWRICNIGGSIFCCHNRGLFLIKPNESRTSASSERFSVDRLNIPDGAWNVLPYGNNLAIACTYSGFYILEKTGNEWRVRSSIPGFDETALYTIVDDQQRIWTAASDGFACLEQTDGKWTVTRTREDAPIAIRQLAAQVFHHETPYGDLILAQEHVTLNSKNIFTRENFFVGGFNNIAFSEDGRYAVVGGIDGFYRINLEEAAQPQLNLPWAIRPEKIVIPWYETWWCRSIMALVILLWAWLIYRLMHHYVQARDARLAAQREAEIHRQEMRILQLENDKAQFDLQHKSQELNNALLERVNRNEIIAWVQEDLRRISDSLQHRDIDTAQRHLRQLQGRLSAGNKRQDKDWKRFEDNFDAVNEVFLSRLRQEYPWMSEEQHRLCVYIYMGLQTKEIGPLLHLSTRGVEMMRYRMRKQMNLDDRINLKQYFESLAK